MLFYVIVVTLLIQTLLMNKFTNTDIPTYFTETKVGIFNILTLLVRYIIMDDGVWMKTHLVSYNNCNIVNT
jgi:hypothetical protein